jgi:hypothetical protein
MKSRYHSKTLWVNLIACVAGSVQLITGEDWIDPKAQVSILGMVNFALRIITNKGLK